MRHAAILLALAALMVAGCAGPFAADRAKAPALAHNVYFTLNDNSPAARARLVADCYTYLKDQPGVTFFAAGEMVEAHARDVNVRDWDVGLHVVFKTKDHHDLYQKADDHQTFIDANADNWKTVRVFDTYIE